MQILHSDPWGIPQGFSFALCGPETGFRIKTPIFLVRAAVSPLWAGFRPLTQEFARELAFQIPDRFSGCFRILNLRLCAGTDIE